MKMIITWPRGRVVPSGDGAPTRTQLDHDRTKTSGKLVVKSILAMGLVVTSGCGSSSNRQVSQQSAPSPSATPRITDTRSLLQIKEAEFTKLPARVQLTKEPYIKGKVAPYFQHVSVEDKGQNKKALWIFDTHSAYDRKYSLAQSPEEVGTVILNKCDEVSMGDYLKGFTEKIPAYGWKCEITIVDKTIPAVIYRQTFQTEFKNVELTRKDDKRISGPPPSIAMNKFLADLPHK